MNWNNVNLNDSYERNQDFLDGYNFDQLLLEIRCNFKKEDITKETILNHIKKSVEIRINSMNEIIESNIDNIIMQALKEKE